MSLLKIWALLVIGLAVLGWIRGKNFVIFSIAGYAGLGALVVIHSGRNSGDPLNLVVELVFVVIATLATSSLIFAHFK